MLDAFGSSRCARAPHNAAAILDRPVFEGLIWAVLVPEALCTLQQFLETVDLLPWIVHHTFMTHHDDGQVVLSLEFLSNLKALVQNIWVADNQFGLGISELMEHYLNLGKGSGGKNL